MPSSTSRTEGLTGSMNEIRHYMTQSCIERANASKAVPVTSRGGHLFQVQHRICRGYPIPMLMKNSDGDRANGFGGNPSLSSRVGAAMPKATRSGDVQINRVYSFSIRSWVQRVGRIASTLSYQLISLAR